MTIKDFRDGNNVIISMMKGEDKSYTFYLVESTGSVFNWNNYFLTAEGRFAEVTEVPDFTFAITNAVNPDDGRTYGTITFPAAMITQYIRQDKIYWKIYAYTKDPVLSTGRVVLYGEIWLTR